MFDKEGNELVRNHECEHHFCLQQVFAGHLLRDLFWPDHFVR